MKLKFIVPCYNAAPNLPQLVASLQEQKDPEWEATFIDDVSSDGTVEYLRSLSDDRITVVANEERKFALRNIIEESRRQSYRSDDPHIVIAVIDGDDQLCNEHAVRLIKEAHNRPGTVAWTAHRWDINGLNISKEMPDRVNPYQHPWCASHMRSFDSALLDSIPDSNFQDHVGRWFERGYDQALMLPLLYRAAVRVYVPDVCYLYKINSCSVDDRDWVERKQLQTVNFVRARGFVSG